MTCADDIRHDVAINAVPMLSDFLLPALMEVAIAHPAVCFRFRPAQTIQPLTPPLPGGNAPVAISLRAGTEPMASDCLTVRPLGVLKVGLFAAESYIMKYGKAEAPADLAGHVLANRDEADNAPWEHWLTRHAPPDMRFILRSDDEAAHRAAVRSGHCAAFMPISARLFNTQLRTVMGPRDEWGAALWMVTPVCGAMPEVVLSAIRMLGDRLARALGNV